MKDLACVWDRGTYRNITDDPNHSTPMSKALADGKVEIFFEGQKIKGGYALIQMQSPRADKTNWLLIKLKDDHVGSLPEDLEDEGQSVTTGRTIQDPAVRSDAVRRSLRRSTQLGRKAMKTPTATVSSEPTAVMPAMFLKHGYPFLR